MRTITLTALAVLSFIGFANSASAQGPVAPVAEHAFFKQFDGVWNATLKINVGPNVPPQESKATMTYKLDHGGLWLISDFRGEGFSGHGVSGYDPKAKKYTGVWVDNMTASLMRMEGTVDKSGKILTETAETVGDDGKPMKVKMITEIKGADANTFTMYSVGSDGKEEQMLQIVYARKK